MKRILSTAVAIITAASALAQNSLPDDPAVKKGKLDNGLTYYIRHNSLPAGRCDFYLVTDVGAIQETPDQDGLAHFLEHMCFNGLKNLPEKQMLEYLQHIGAEFGRNINAGTGIEHTNYRLTDIPLTREGILDTCLLVLHDWSHFVTLDPKEIEAERGVILEEKRTRNDAGWRLFEKSLPIMYGNSKYATCTLIGSEDNLKNFKPQSLNNFYESWYRPDMQAVVIVGDIDADKVYDKVKTLFADIPAPEKKTEKTMPEVELNDKPVVGILTDPENTSTSVDFIWKLGKPEDKEYNATDAAFIERLFKTTVAVIMSERFDEILSKADAPFTSASLSLSKLCATRESLEGSVSAENSKILEACRAFLTEVEKMKRFGFSEDEVERVKDKLVKTYTNKVNGAPTRMNGDLTKPLINNFLQCLPYPAPEKELEFVKEACKWITPEALSTYLSGKLKDGCLTIIYSGIDKEDQVHPSEEQLLGIVKDVEAADIKAGFAAAIDKNFLQGRKIKAGKILAEDKALYGATVWTLGNGMRVVALPTEYKKNQVIFDLRMKGGLSLIPTADIDSFNDNVTDLFFSNSGIAQFSSTTATKMLAGRTAGIQPYISSIYNGISGASSPEDIETALQLLYLQVVAPRFDEEEWNVGIKQLNTVLPNMLSTPDYAFSQHLYKSVFGDSRRKKVISGETLENASLKTFKKGYGKMFNGVGGATLYIVGNFDIESLKPLVEKYCASLPKGKCRKDWNAANVDKYSQGADTDVFTTKMNTPKVSVVQFYNADVPYSLQKSVDLSAARFILRMIYTETLREKEGGTYGASASMSLSREPFSRVNIQVSFDTNTEKCDKLRELAIQGLKELAENGPTEEQLLRAKGNTLKRLPEQRISNAYWLSVLKCNDSDGGDYDAEYAKAVDNISSEGIKAALNEVLASGNFIEVVMKPEE